jgi:hypothetical protein
MNPVRAARTWHAETDPPSGRVQEPAALPCTPRHLRNVIGVSGGLPQPRRDLDRPGRRKLSLGHLEEILSVDGKLRRGLRVGP